MNTWKRTVRISWWDFRLNRVDRIFLHKMYREMRSIDDLSREDARDQLIAFCLENFSSTLRGSAK